MLRQSLLIFCTLLILISFVACHDPSGKSNDNHSDDTVVQQEGASNIPLFNPDSAYNYIAKQVSFGPRVPGTKAQEECAAWLYSALQQSCDTVYKQETTLLAGDKKTKLRCINLIGVINPKATHRVLLLSHWDSRPWADQDVSNKETPIDGADDGASGVGVLIELARVIKSKPLPQDIGVDILFTDVEDWGKSEWGDSSYALGTQYWAHNPHVKNYTAQAGILLDMVGAPNARFAVEAFSQQYANAVITQVWGAAEAAGFGNYFVYENGAGITDDHIPVNEIIKIPTIDIINLPAGSQSAFVAHWHTHQDNMSNIDKATLKAVGQTLLQYLFTSKPV